MAKKTDRFIAIAKPVEDLVYHNVGYMSETGGGVTLYNYLDSSLVEGADLTVYGRYIKNVQPGTKPYVEPHKHEVSEAFLFLGTLSADVMLDGEKHEVTAPACVYIPAEMMHNITVTKGSGNIVVIVRGQRYE